MGSVQDRSHPLGCGAGAVPSRAQLFPSSCSGLSKESSCQALVRTAEHPQPGLGDYGFEFRAVAVFPPTAFDQTGLGCRVCSQTGNGERIGWRDCKLGFGATRSRPCFTPRCRCRLETKPVKLVISGARLAGHRHPSTHALGPIL